MTYFLQSFRGKAIPLDDAEAKALNDALDSIFAQIAFEELWDAVVQNFADLERDTLRHALEDMIFGDKGWNHYQDMRTLFARRLANLLSSCRAYIDLSPRQLRCACPNTDAERQFSALKSAAYDGSFSYRLMEALRNYTQHYGSPISGTHFDARRIEQPTGNHFRYVTAASISAEKLRDDPKFKASVRAELVGMDKLEVNKHVREYVEQLGGVHMALRTLAIDSTSVEWPLITSAIERIRSDDLAEDFGSYIVSILGGKESSRRALMREPIKRLNNIRSRNGSLQGLASRYVSGELMGQHLR